MQWEDDSNGKLDIRRAQGSFHGELMWSGAAQDKLGEMRGEEAAEREARQAAQAAAAAEEEKAKKREAASKAIRTRTSWDDDEIRMLEKGLEKFPQVCPVPLQSQPPHSQPFPLRSQPSHSQPFPFPFSFPAIPHSHSHSQPFPLRSQPSCLRAHPAHHPRLPDSACLGPHL